MFALERWSKTSQKKHESKLRSLLSATNVDVESYWPDVFAKAVNCIDVNTIVGNVGAGSGSAAGEAAEAKKEEPDDNMGFFD